MKKGSNASHEMYACDDADDSRGRGGGRERGRGARWGKHERGGRGTNEEGGGSAAVAGGDGSSAKAAIGSILARRYYRCGKKGHNIADCT